jgi:hypothetical protein
MLALLVREGRTHSSAIRRRSSWSTVRGAATRMMLEASSAQPAELRCPHLQLVRQQAPRGMLQRRHHRRLKSCPPRLRASHGPPTPTAAEPVAHRASRRRLSLSTRPTEHRRSTRPSPNRPIRPRRRERQTSSTVRRPAASRAWARRLDSTRTPRPWVPHPEDGHRPGGLYSRLPHRRRGLRRRIPRLLPRRARGSTRPRRLHPLPRRIRCSTRRRLRRRRRPRATVSHQTRG